MKKTTCLACFALIFAAIANARASGNLCPVPFVAVDDKCYFLSKGRATWQDAYFQCKEYNASLPVLVEPRQQHRDASLGQFLTAASNSKNQKPIECWIGGRYDWKQKLWKWADSANPIEFVRGFERPRRDFKNHWQCIVVDSRLRLIARKCTSKKHYVCEAETNAIPKKKRPLGRKDNSRNQNEVLGKSRPEFIKQKPNPTRKPAATSKKSKPTRTNRKPKLFACPSHMILLRNKCYYFSTEEVSWDDAHFACIENKTKLAVMRSKRDDDVLRKFLNQNFVPSKERWIGGKYDWEQKTWKWAINGRKIEYENFAKALSNRENLQWHSIVMDPKYRNRWNWKMDLKRKAYICQTKANVIPFNGSEKNHRRMTLRRMQNGNAFDSDGSNGNVTVTTYSLALKSLKSDGTLGDLRSRIRYYDGNRKNPLHPKLISEEYAYRRNFHSLKGH